MVKIEIANRGAYFSRVDSSGAMCTKGNINSLARLRKAHIKPDKQYWVSTNPLKNSLVLELNPKTADNFFLKYCIPGGGYLEFCYNSLQIMLKATKIPKRIYYKEVSHG